MTRRTVLASAATLLVLLPAAAMAATKEVSVDARAGPWSPALNKNMPYGAGDAAPPVVVTGFSPDSGLKLAIMPDGTTATKGHPQVGAEGIAGQAVDDTLGPHKKRYPSFYTPKILYPANAHALVGVFLDAKGAVVGRPFVVGSGVRVPIADGATGLGLGFNDASAAGNSGALKVTVELPDE